ncbi:MarR family winged helix-turn-helix transcriptional regulator [uncultured Desulfobacter sp.]|uniref:MarR family winged helix-turn-helix transcriptional regulator n=1 Tax=uncultured Desulfobacter sp. TaxID=240139 RepID=UPI0029F569AB|nr:MarR family winged helix-turn-helix transcriptional regulator [uncultured Desulfobacter sp.]
MIIPYNTTYFSPSKVYRRLSILMLIKDMPHSSQHLIAQKSHLSSSMVNIYIKELKQAGLITVSGKTNRTTEYHLTQKGQKKLFQDFISFSSEAVQIYASVKREIIRLLKRYETNGIRTVVLYGASDTAEVVVSAIPHTRLVVIGIVDGDPSKQGHIFNGTLIQAPEAISQIDPDAVLITSFARQDEIYNNIESILGEDIEVLTLTDLQQLQQTTLSEVVR